MVKNNIVLKLSELKINIINAKMTLLYQIIFLVFCINNNIFLFNNYAVANVIKINQLRQINPVLYWENPNEDYDFQIFKKNADNRTLVSFSDINSGYLAFKQDKITLQPGEYEVEVYKLQNEKNRIYRKKIDLNTNNDVVFRWNGLDKVNKDLIQQLKINTHYTKDLKNSAWFEMENNINWQRIKIIIKYKNNFSVDAQIYRIDKETGFLKPFNKYFTENKVEFRAFTRTENQIKYLYQEIILTNFKEKNFYLILEQENYNNNASVDIIIIPESIKGYEEFELYEDDIKYLSPTPEKINIRKEYCPIYLKVSSPGLLKLRTENNNKLGIDILNKNFISIYYNNSISGNIKEYIVDITEPGEDYYILLENIDYFENTARLECDLYAYFIPYKNLIQGQEEYDIIPVTAGSLTDKITGKPAMRIYETYDEAVGYPIPEVNYRRAFQTIFHSSANSKNFLNNYEKILLNIDNFLKIISPNEQYYGKFGQIAGLGFGAATEIEKQYEWIKIDNISSGPFKIQLFSDNPQASLIVQIFSFYMDKWNLIAYDEVPERIDNQAIYELNFEIPSKDKKYYLYITAAGDQVCSYKLKFSRPTVLDYLKKLKSNQYEKIETNIDSFKYESDRFNKNSPDKILYSKVIIDKVIYKSNRKDAFEVKLSSGLWKINLNILNQNIIDKDFGELFIKIYKNNFPLTGFSFSSQENNYLLINAYDDIYTINIQSEYRGKIFSFYPIYYKLSFEKIKQKKISYIYTLD